MDLIDQIKTIGIRVEKLKEQVETEEATKNAFIMPFIAALGYDVFNPTEVVPEFTADVGIKKGEKVDYCIMKDGVPCIIMECKHWKSKLSNNHNSQLVRYFHVTKARFSILTNGIQYRIYSDLDAPNIMDERPFLEFDITGISEGVALELKKFHKSTFNVEDILSTASDLKYTSLIKELVARELKDPSEDFIKYCIAKVYPGRMTGKVVEQFNDLVKRSIKSMLADLVNERIHYALEKGVEDDTPDDGIETTAEEMQGFRMVQAIIAPHIDLGRVSFKDQKTFFGVIIDDSTRKQLCKFWFNKSQKYLSIFNTEKKEEKVAIDRLEDIYKYSSDIINHLKSF